MFLNHNILRTYVQEVCAKKIQNPRSRDYGSRVQSKAVIDNTGIYADFARTGRRILQNRSMIEQMKFSKDIFAALKRWSLYGSPSKFHPKLLGGQLGTAFTDSLTETF
jgi:hypothetical protein